ncbi:MAG: ORF6N domain-containing protein [bacterium]
MQIITYDQVKTKVIKIRDQSVILDNDVAELYGVETRKINQAIREMPTSWPSVKVEAFCGNLKFPFKICACNSSLYSLIYPSFSAVFQC